MATEAGKMPHTPGPWDYEVHENGCVFVTSPTTDGRGDIADLYVNEGHSIATKENAEANAMLIAAAPDLYDALIALVQAEHSDDMHLWIKAKTALAKARGEK
jgi:hypothetical protein